MTPGADAAYATAMLDWLACASAGRREAAPLAATALGQGLEERVAAAGAAGHVLDFDDTYTPGLAHLSAPTAPAALVLGAELGSTVAELLDAYAAGFEAMAALARANHPALYERGWHPTAVCGAVGAAVAAGELLRLGEERAEAAVRLALLSASGLRAAFGSDGKSLQVGMAAAAGVRAARLAAAGAAASAAVVEGFESAYGARWVDLDGAGGAIEDNWIKAYPCCLQTHSAIEAAASAAPVPAGAIVVAVHPISLYAASVLDPETGLEAKFSLPYLVAYTLLHGPPEVASFLHVDGEARALAAERVSVRADEALLESEAVLEVDGGEVARVESALGSPARAMDAEALEAKVRSLSGDALTGVLDDPERPARSVLEAAGL